MSKSSRSRSQGGNPNERKAFIRQGNPPTVAMVDSLVDRGECGDARIFARKVGLASLLDDPTSSEDLYASLGIRGTKLG